MAQNIPINLDQGTTYEHTFTCKDKSGSVLDLSSYSARGHVRKEYGSDSIVLNLGSQASLEVIDALSASSSSSSSGSTFEATGKVKLTIDPSASSNLSAGRYLYDIEIYNDAGNVYRVCEGPFVLRPEITKVS